MKLITDDEAKQLLTLILRRKPISVSYQSISFLLEKDINIKVSWYVGTPEENVNDCTSSFDNLKSNGVAITGWIDTVSNDFSFIIDIDDISIAIPKLTKKELLKYMETIDNIILEYEKVKINNVINALKNN